MAAEREAEISKFEQVLQRLRKEEHCVLKPTIQRLEMIMSKIKVSSECVRTVEKQNGLVPLTESMYVPGKIHTSEKVLIDIGTGYLVEMDIADSLKYFQRRMQYLQKQIDAVESLQKENTISQQNALHLIQQNIVLLQNMTE